MPLTSSALNRIAVAVPCHVSWDGMPGDDRVRYCRLCKQNVYNLSGMTRKAAETLIREKEGRVCIRLYRRRDGSVLTSDCIGGLLAFRRRVAAAVALAATLLLGMMGWAGFQVIAGPRRDAPLWVRDVEPFRTVLKWIDPTQVVQGESPPVFPPVTTGAGTGPPAAGMPNGAPPGGVRP